MGKYTVIAEVGSQLCRILERGLVPELVPDGNAIGLCSPEERGDLTVGIFLYDIRENEDYRVNGMINAGIDRQSFPPIYLSLYYMITVWSASDLKFRAVQEHRLLGRILQLLTDQNLVNASLLGDSQGLDLRIEFLNLPLEEKQRIWNMPNTPMRTSLFFKAAPVALESEKTREIRRVSLVELETEEKEAAYE